MVLPLTIVNTVTPVWLSSSMRLTSIWMRYLYFVFTFIIHILFITKKWWVDLHVQGMETSNPRSGDGNLAISKEE